MDVKERTSLSDSATNARHAVASDLTEGGGPDRTRTYDPRLIKAVL